MLTMIHNVLVVRVMVFIIRRTLGSQLLLALSKHEILLVLQLEELVR
jgi:hypothetical protein